MAFLALAFLGTVLHWSFPQVASWSLSVYGVLVLFHLCMQMTFASLNRVRMQRMPLMEGDPSVGIQVVGYREDPEFFRKCLRSVVDLRYPNIRKVLVVSDGNKEEDMYLEEIFREEMGGDVVWLNAPLSELSVYERLQVVKDIKTRGKYVMVFQPNGGKREAMYTAFQSLLHEEVEYVLPTDSDTILDPDAVVHLLAPMENPRIGAVTGDVKIWNNNRPLSFFSALRYWFAFNLERSAQSFFGVVTCVSGPLGLYRSSVLRKVIDPWVDQRFLGEKCTYGDDRHLTNRILGEGYKVVYTHFAYCFTETPTNFTRWVSQQTRWSKSFYRELLFNVRSFHKHELWLTYDLLYQGLYPFFLLYSIIWHGILSFQEGTFTYLILWMLTIFMGGWARSLFAYAWTGKRLFYLYFIYSYLYIAGILPAKIYALLTLWDTSWGTSPRKFLYSDEEGTLGSGADATHNPVFVYDQNR